MSTRGQDITKILNELVAPVQKLNILLQQDRVSYKMIEGDVESLLLKHKKLFAEMEDIKAENERAKVLGNSILEVAKESAAKIMADVNTKRVEALKMVEDAKDYATKIDKAYHQGLMEKLDSKFDKVLGRK